MDKMMLLDKISTPADLRGLSTAELENIAAEIRKLIVDTVSRNGGHLASSLGAVDFIVALHRVFGEGDGPFFFDVGHQAYAHKILTGRRENFGSLRQFGGISGFPCPLESPSDPAAAGHAGTAISLALGVAAAREHAGVPGKVIAVVGDASLANGISLEALNSTRHGGKKLLIVLNDNQMSISRNVGALARRLNRVIAGDRYNRFKRRMRNLLVHLPRHELLHSVVRRLEDGIKSVLLPPGGFFQSLGVRYIGPVDGHAIGDLIKLFESLKALDGPVLVHLVTEKGRGCEFARRDPARYHGVAGFDPENGKLPCSSGGFSAAFGKAMVKLAAARPEVDAVSAAMVAGTGLREFRRLYPERCFDAGIAEEHAAAFCAGLAQAGRRPVFAVYATFMQRALDCVYHDAVLNGFPVIFALDRAGAVEDGPTHHGIYDLGFLRELPGLVIMAPRCESQLEPMLKLAYDLKCPVAIRYPRGSGAKAPASPPPAALESGRAEVLREGTDAVIWTLGPESDTAFAVAGILEKQSIDCAVIDARFIAPFDRETALSRAAVPQFSIENHCVSGGLGSALAEALSEFGSAGLTRFGWPADRVIPHGKLDDLRREFGLDAVAIAAKIKTVLQNRQK